MDVSSILEECRIGIICVTRDNLHAPWVLFEAGALAKAMDKAMVCPYLIDMTPSELSGPLSQFQVTVANKSDTLKLLQSINCQLDERRLEDDQLRKTFEHWWPELQSVLKEVEAAPERAKAPLRSDREVLDEVLEIIRAQFGHGRQIGLPGPAYHTASVLKFPRLSKKTSVAIESGTTVSEVMDSLYFELDGLVEPYTYLETWVVQEPDDGARVIIREVQSRIPARCVFLPGSVWEVVPLATPYDASGSRREDYPT